MQLAGKDFPLTKKQVQAFIDSIESDKFLAYACNGQFDLMARAYCFYHPDSVVFVNYDLVNINGLDYYLKPWQRGMLRRIDKRFGVEAFSRQDFEGAGGLKAFARFDPVPTNDEW